MTSIRGVVVADDLTGANDTGHQFATRGYETTVTADTEAVTDGTDVVVCNTDSRYRSPDDAANRVADAVENHPASVVYKKIDSTLRGNLITEITAVIDAAGSDLVVVAPAFPRTNRITVSGMHLVDGTPVAATAAGRDPDKPVTDSHLPTLLSGLEYPLTGVDLPTVERGAEEVERTLRPLAATEDPVVVVCDATRDEHLESIAAAAAALDETVTYVGSGGLAQYVKLETSDAHGVLGVVGSASPQTFEQLSALNEEVVVVLDTELAVEESDAAVRDATERAIKTMQAHRTAVLTAARSSTDVKSTLEQGVDAGLTEAETCDRIASSLGSSATAVYGERQVTGVFATGGAVATQLLEQLGGTGVRLTGQAVASGVPVTRVVGGTAAGTPLITKAGAFGDEETIYNSLLYLSRYYGD
jgi:uncharacterized protein YgbK (DUF1537 family)